METKTVEIDVEWGSFGGVGIGSHAETGWIIDKIAHVVTDENGVKIICDCIHEEYYKF